jgi:predicted component of type VI protein secretion system
MLAQSLRKAQQLIHTLTFSQSGHHPLIHRPSSREVTLYHVAHSKNLALSSNNDSDQVNHQAAEETGKSHADSACQAYVCISSTSCSPALPPHSRFWMVILRCR